MKAHTLFLTTILITGFFTQSCRKGSMWGIKGEGANVTETKTISGFSGIDLSVNADVSYTQDSIYKVEITGQQNILAITDMEVSGQMLKIDFKRNVWNYRTLKITIHSPKMNKIDISGSGTIYVENQISDPNLNVKISGSGNISIPTISVQSLKADLSGSGNITINSGTCTSEYFNISGTGNINTEFLNAVNGDVKISGSGSVVINASQTLRVNISGSGNVKYKGTPTVDSDISGNGKLIHIN